ncbi:MAG: Malonyl CoA-acyl carrier protein transacylase [Chlamydiae bacterium]|nr:Malonyl CoA-acyl carrier protein transacylase [Chlamydiota bacterium]
MSRKVAFLFPGQGAQYPGMGRDFFENFSAAKQVFAKADEILGYPFSELIFNGSAEKLTLTKNSQLAIFITSIAILRVLQEQNPDLKPTMCGGLSLGEYTALVAAGKLTFEEALPLVKARGEFMDEACTNRPGTMQVVLGLELPIVEEVVSGLSGVWIANLNCPGQIVISGTKEGIEKAASQLKEKGARRVMPLDVSGAFHSGLMQSAQDRLAPLIQEVHMSNSDVVLVMNACGDKVEALEELRKNMIEQVISPVCWQSCVESMVDSGVELFIEMGPGKTLAGMNKRIGVQIPTVSVEKVEEVEYAPTT